MDALPSRGLLATGLTATHKPSNFIVCLAFFRESMTFTMRSPVIRFTVHRSAADITNSSGALLIKPLRIIAHQPFLHLLPTCFSCALGGPAPRIDSTGSGVGLTAIQEVIRPVLTEQRDRPGAIDPFTDLLQFPAYKEGRILPVDGVGGIGGVKEGRSPTGVTSVPNVGILVIEPWILSREAWNIEGIRYFHTLMAG